MKMTYSIKTVLRTDKVSEDGLIPIYYSLRCGPTVTRIPTGKKVTIANWNIKECCPKKNCKNNQLLAAYLTKQINDWHTYMLQLETMGKPITITIASAFFNGNAKVTFYNFFQEQIDLWEVEKAYNTIKTYKSTLNVLKQFNNKLNFGDLTYLTIQQFDLYMSKTRSNSVGGKFTKHKNLKCVIREAIKKGFMTTDQNPYRFFKIKSAVGKREFLTISEVTKLMNLDIPEKNGFHNRVRDLFLFSCFSGLRYSDLMNLKWSNVDLKKHCLTVQMVKTKKVLTIPLVPQAERIIEKYGKHIIKTPTLRVMPKMANQVLNREIKILMDDLGIQKHITFHASRHTFASNLIEAKTNILYVRDLLGHSQLSETQIYAKSLMSDLHSTMDNLASMYGQAV
ncbi:MAG TPA: site-specific integrase [Mucilaginibacter sp.]|jgi:site-specific recombinase XerD|nr:site-specific integrase [Mucilaginibacter sp.]